MFVPSLSWQNDLVASQENWHTKGDDFSALTELHDPIRQQKRPTADPMHQHAVEITLTLQPEAPQGQSQQAQQSEGSWTAALEAGRQSSREASAPLIGRLAWSACSYCRVTAASTLRYSLR